MLNKWHYDSPVGTFWIEPDNEKNGAWKLRVDQRPLGTFENPRVAAIEVSAKKTGYHPWDEAVEMPQPVYLEDWRLEEVAA